MPDTIKPEQWPVQSQSTHHKCKGDKTGDTCAANMKQISICLVSNQGRKKITKKQITWIMTCSKSEAIALGVSKQDNINGTCTANMEQIISWLANNTVNKITEIMT